MYKLFQQSPWYPSGKDTRLSPISPGAFLFTLSLLPKLRCFGVCFIILLILFSAFVSHFKSSTAADLFSHFPLQSSSSSPSLSFCHSVMPLFLSLSITLPFLSLYHTASVHFFASTLLRCSLSLSFFFGWFCVCYFTWCMVFRW